MQKFTVEFAKLNIEINSEYEYSHNFCKDYLSDKAPDFSVSVKSEEIDEEIEISEFTPTRGYAESICVYREIAKKLPFYDRFVFHGAVISCGGDGFIFTAPSGTGKTTHIMLWKKYIEGVEVVNGDKPIIRVTDEGVTAYATPYAGKERMQNHSSVGIKAICILKRGTENRIKKVRASECISDIVRQVYIPPEPDAVMATFDLLDKMLRQIDIYILECDISEEAVKCSYEAMSGKKYISAGD